MAAEAPVVHRREMRLARKIQDAYGPRPAYIFEARELIGICPPLYMNHIRNFVAPAKPVGLAGGQERQVFMIGHDSAADWTRMRHLNISYHFPNTHPTHSMAGEIDTRLIARQSWPLVPRGRSEHPDGNGSLIGYYRVAGIERANRNNVKTFIGAHVAANDAYVTLLNFLAMATDSSLSVQEWPLPGSPGYIEGANPYDLENPLPVLKNTILIAHDTEFHSQPGERAGRERCVPEVGLAFLDLNEVASIPPGRSCVNWYRFIKTHNVYPRMITLGGVQQPYAPRRPLFTATRVQEHVVADQNAIAGQLDSLVLQFCHQSFPLALPPPPPPPPPPPAPPADWRPVRLQEAGVGLPDGDEFQRIMANMCLDNIAKGEQCRHFAECSGAGKYHTCPDFLKASCPYPFRHQATYHTLRKCKALPYEGCHLGGCRQTYYVYHILPNCKDLMVNGECGRNACVYGHDAPELRFQYFNDRVNAGIANFQRHNT